MIRRLGIVLGAVLVLAGCANPRSEAAARAGTELVGIPKEMLYSCAGVPDREQQVGDRERITYVRGSTYSHVEVDRGGRAAPERQARGHDGADLSAADRRELLGREGARCLAP